MSRSVSRINQLARVVRTAFLEEAHAGGTVQLKVDLDPYGMF
ncbi:MAG: hypothetical protein BWX80_03029 [Candidatus Hydrogenedentes bacterium ADurb.Bin101]|nr:MAG: hypothetical protein BWX80_03029 [Candidatus Hydrogenedentes bacterium ADurb.Bin101]